MRFLEDTALLEEETPVLWVLRGGRASCQAGTRSWGRRSMWHQEVVEEKDVGDQPGNVLHLQNLPRDQLPLCVLLLKNITLTFTPGFFFFCLLRASPYLGGHFRKLWSYF